MAREISVDVRETVRTIREELASAAKGFRNGDGRDDARQTEPDAAEPDGASEDDRAEPRRIREEARRSREQMRASFRQGRRAADWPAWSAWSEWADTDGETGSASGPGVRGRAKAACPGHGGQGPFGDLERMAMQFATELRAAARQTGNLGDRSLNELRDILTDTLAKVRSEVFTDPEVKSDSQKGQPSPGEPSDADRD